MPQWTPTRNKQTVRRVFEEGFTAGDVAVIDECLAPGAVDRHEFTDEEGDFRGHLKAIITMFRASFPDLRCRSTISSPKAIGSRHASS